MDCVNVQLFLLHDVCIYAVVQCPSVHPSVTHVLCQNKLIIKQLALDCTVGFVASEL